MFRILLLTILCAARYIPLECQPQWYIDNKSCPRGIRGIGDVTIPHDWNDDMWVLFLVICGYLPYVISLILVITLIYRRGTTQFLILGTVVAGLLANEFGIKNILKQPRPHVPAVPWEKSSCIPSCGMASSHSLVVVGGCSAFFFIALLWVTSDKDALAKRSHTFRWYLLDAPSAPISPGEFASFFCFWGMLAVFLPSSRALLGDHTWRQVMVGSAMGLAVGFLTVCLYKLVATKEENTDEKFCFLNKNTVDPKTTIKALKEDRKPENYGTVV